VEKVTGMLRWALKYQSFTPQLDTRVTSGALAERYSSTDSRMVLIWRLGRHRIAPSILPVCVLSSCFLERESRDSHSLKNLKTVQ
jgi:hypothetical protein